MTYLGSVAILIRRCVYTFLGSLDAFFRRTPHRIVIFCFHSIAEDNWRFSIDREVFLREIAYLLRTRKPITLSDVEGYILGKKQIAEPSFVVCFDDGYRDILEVREFLKEQGIKPALFVLSHPGEANTVELGTDRPLLSREEILRLREDGWAIGSHSATHSDFSILDEAGIQKETGESKKALENSLGFAIEYFAYPRGRYTDAVLTEVKNAGYRMALSMDDGRINTKTSLLAAPRVGVDRTHSLREFRYISSPSVICFRQLIKKFAVTLF